MFKVMQSDINLYFFGVGMCNQLVIIKPYVQYTYMDN